MIYRCIYENPRIAGSSQSSFRWLARVAWPFVQFRLLALHGSGPLADCEAASAIP
jgi:hypothetical protein